MVTGPSIAKSSLVDTVSDRVSNFLYDTFLGSGVPRSNSELIFSLLNVENLYSNTPLTVEDLQRRRAFTEVQLIYNNQVCNSACPGNLFVENLTIPFYNPEETNDVDQAHFNESRSSYDVRSSVSRSSDIETQPRKFGSCDAGTKLKSVLFGGADSLVKNVGKQFASMTAKQVPFLRVVIHIYPPDKNYAQIAVPIHAVTIPLNQVKNLWTRDWLALETPPKPIKDLNDCHVIGDFERARNFGENHMVPRIRVALQLLSNITKQQPSLVPKLQHPNLFPNNHQRSSENLGPLRMTSDGAMRTVRANPRASKLSLLQRQEENQGPRLEFSILEVENIPGLTVEDIRRGGRAFVELRCGKDFCHKTQNSVFLDRVSIPDDDEDAVIFLTVYIHNPYPLADRCTRPNQSLINSGMPQSGGFSFTNGASNFAEDAGRHSIDFGNSKPLGQLMTTLAEFSSGTDFLSRSQDVNAVRAAVRADNNDRKAAAETSAYQLPVPALTLCIPVSSIRLDEDDFVYWFGMETPPKARPYGDVNEAYSRFDASRQTGHDRSMPRMKISIKTIQSPNSEHPTLLQDLDQLSRAATETPMGGVQKSNPSLGSCAKVAPQQIVDPQESEYHIASMDVSPDHSARETRRIFDQRDIGNADIHVAQNVSVVPSITGSKGRPPRPPNTIPSFNLSQLQETIGTLSATLSGGSNHEQVQTPQRRDSKDSTQNLSYQPGNMSTRNVTATTPVNNSARFSARQMNLCRSPQVSDESFDIVTKKQSHPPFPGSASCRSSLYDHGNINAYRNTNSHIPTSHVPSRYSPPRARPDDPRGDPRRKSTVCNGGRQNSLYNPREHVNMTSRPDPRRAGESSMSSASNFDRESRKHRESDCRMQDCRMDGARTERPESHYDSRMQPNVKQTGQNHSRYAPFPSNYYSRQETYIPFPEDRVDQKVAHILNVERPDLRDTNTIERVRAGKYDINDRPIQVTIENHRGAENELIVYDGPLRQPFREYLIGTDADAEYSFPDIPSDPTTALQAIPKHQRLSFNNPKPLSRLEAMKLATQQATVREYAARETLNNRHEVRNLQKSVAKMEEVLTNLNSQKLVHSGSDNTTAAASSNSSEKEDKSDSNSFGKSPDMSTPGKSQPEEQYETMEDIFQKAYASTMDAHFQSFTNIFDGAYGTART